MVHYLGEKTVGLAERVRSTLKCSCEVIPPAFFGPVMFSEASADPGDGTTVIGSIIISGTTTDPNDEETLDLVEVRIDAGSWEEAEGTTDWEFGLDTTACRMGSTSCHPGPMT